MLDELAGDNLFDAPGHFDRRSARKGQKHDPLRIDAVDHQMRRPRCNDLRLAGPRPGDNGKWSAAERAAVRNAIGHRAPLAAVEIVEVLARHGRTFESSTMTDSVEPIVPLHEADGTEYLRSIGKPCVFWTLIDAQSRTPTHGHGFLHGNDRENLNG